MILLHDERCAGYETPGHPERPARVTRAVPYLKQRHPDWEWRKPEAATRENALLAHTPEHWDRLAEPADFDPDTAFHPGIRDHALHAVGSGLEALHLAQAGQPSFSLMRPPGHHACPDRAMGFCYLGTVAITALSAVKNGAERVAIWDIDAHHGNGTEAIVEGHEAIRFCSVHQYPGYPGTGTKTQGNCFNWTVAPNAPRREHLDKLRRSFDEVLGHRPDVVIVSAGFDAFAGDPITNMRLEPEDFLMCGQLLRSSQLPTASILEGGYSDQLPELIDAYLSGLTAA